MVKKKNREFQKSTLSKEQNKKNARRKSNAHIEGRSDVIRRNIGSNINFLLSFCFWTLDRCLKSKLRLSMHVLDHGVNSNEKRIWLS